MVITLLPLTLRSKKIIYLTFQAASFRWKLSQYSYRGQSFLWPCFVVCSLTKCPTRLKWVHRGEQTISMVPSWIVCWDTLFISLESGYNSYSTQEAPLWGSLSSHRLCSSRGRHLCQRTSKYSSLQETKKFAQVHLGLLSCVRPWFYVSLCFLLQCNTRWGGLWRCSALPSQVCFYFWYPFMRFYEQFQL